MAVSKWCKRKAPCNTQRLTQRVRSTPMACHQRRIRPLEALPCSNRVRPMRQWLARPRAACKMPTDKRPSHSKVGIRWKVPQAPILQLSQLQRGQDRTWARSIALSLFRLSSKPNGSASTLTTVDGQALRWCATKIATSPRRGRSKRRSTELKSSLKFSTRWETWKTTFHFLSLPATIGRVAPSRTSSIRGIRIWSKVPIICHRTCIQRQLTLLISRSISNRLQSLSC